MKKPNDHALIPNVQTISREGADDFYVIGDDRADFTSGDAVAVGVNVNFLLRDGDKSRGHSITLHEIPLMRRMYPSGTVAIYPDWVPGIDRCMPLTRRMFEEELKRLVRSYTIPRENGGANKIFAEVYGETEADATKKMHAGMKAIYEGWKALEKRALAAFRAAGGDLAQHGKGAVHALITRYFTAEDLDALVALVEPMPSGLESVKLSSINMSADTDSDMGDDATTFGPQDADAGDEQRTALIADLMQAGFTRVQADELTVLAMEDSPALADVMLEQSSLAVNGIVEPKLAKKARKICAAWAERQKVTT